LRNKKQIIFLKDENRTLSIEKVRHFLGRQGKAQGGKGSESGRSRKDRVRVRRRKMWNLQFQLHSQPSILSSLSSLSSSSHKLFPNHSFSPNSLPFNPPKPFSLRCRHSDLFDQNTLASSQRPTRPTASGTTYFSSTPFFFFFLICSFKTNVDDN